jgi:hypothetical protein
MSLSIKKTNLYFKMLYQFLTSIDCVKNAKFSSLEETVEIILKNRKSFIRFGDGEFDIIEGKNIHYQEYSEDLGCYLDKIIREYIDGGNGGSYYVGMPNTFLTMKALRLLRSRLYLSCWSHARYYFKKNYDKNIIYGNTCLFSEGNEHIYEKIWNKANIDKVIFVHNSEVYAKKFEQIYNIKEVFVKIPPKNAYTDKNEIVENIIDRVTDKDKNMVLISAGPCGKVLVYELSKQGIWAIDTGHCWDNPLNDN